MIDIYDFFIKNAENDNYHSFLADTLKYELENYEEIPRHRYFSEFELINDFKAVVDPKNDKNITSKNQDKFITMCYYLKKHNYYIKQFPSLFDDLDDEYCLPKFVLSQIPEYIIQNSNYKISKVNKKIKKDFINELEFLKYDDIDKNIDIIIKMVSTRDAHFINMSIDEKLENICKSIEFFLKDRNKYKEIELSNLDDVITNEMIKKYRKKLHCFRHGSKDSIRDRNKYSILEKEILIDFGIFFINTILKVQKK